MINSGKRALWINVVIVALFITGCAGSKIAESVTAEGRTDSLQESPGELVNKLGSAISEARTAQLNILSPNAFKRAETAYLSAREYLEKGNKIKDIRSSVAESRFHLQKAKEFATISRETLVDTLNARDLARNAGATQYEKAYRRVEDDFLDLSRAIERGDSDKARKDREKVAEGYRELEIRAIKEDTIGSIRALIAQAKAADARKIAPRTYEKTTAQLAATDAFISANPYAKEKMHAMAKVMLFEANRLVGVTSAGNRMKTMPPEDIVLLVEDHLHQIATTLDAQDMRNHDFQTQLNNIIGSVAALKQDRDFIAEKNATLQAEMETLKADNQARIDALNVQIAMLEGKTREDQMAKERMARERMAAEQRLAAERKFNQRYVSVRGYFAKDEAEVYKQENQLVLRLKAMQFPVGKSIIMPENYSLLSKVQKAIRTFDDPRVIIEGHTDATGSNDVNMLLSQQRADAVRDYLITNQTLAPETISAVGYGSERPLASNATPAGRAINRRIDIMIIPQDNPI